MFSIHWIAFYCLMFADFTIHSIHHSFNVAKQFEIRRCHRRSWSLYEQAEYASDFAIQCIRYYVLNRVQSTCKIIFYYNLRLHLFICKPKVLFVFHFETKMKTNEKRIKNSISFLRGYRLDVRVCVCISVFSMCMSFE